MGKHEDPDEVVTEQQASGEDTTPQQDMQEQQQQQDGCNTPPNTGDVGRRVVSASFTDGELYRHMLSKDDLDCLSTPSRPVDKKILWMDGTMTLGRPRHKVQFLNHDAELVHELVFERFARDRSSGRRTRTRLIPDKYMTLPNQLKLNAEEGEEDLIIKKEDVHKMESKPPMATPSPKEPEIVEDGKKDEDEGEHSGEERQTLGERIIERIRRALSPRSDGRHTDHEEADDESEPEDKLENKEVVIDTDKPADKKDKKKRTKRMKKKSKDKDKKLKAKKDKKNKRVKPIANNTDEVSDKIDYATEYPDDKVDKATNDKEKSDDEHKVHTVKQEVVAKVLASAEAVPPPVPDVSPPKSPEHQLDNADTTGIGKVEEDITKAIPDVKVEDKVEADGEIAVTVPTLHTEKKEKADDEEDSETTPKKKNNKKRRTLSFTFLKRPKMKDRSSKTDTEASDEEKKDTENRDKGSSADTSLENAEKDTPVTVTSDDEGKDHEKKEKKKMNLHLNFPKFPSLRRSKSGDSTPQSPDEEEGNKDKKESPREEVIVETVEVIQKAPSDKDLSKDSEKESDKESEPKEKKPTDKEEKKKRGTGPYLSLKREKKTKKKEPADVGEREVDNSEEDVNVDDIVPKSVRVSGGWQTDFDVNLKRELPKDESIQEQDIVKEFVDEVVEAAAAQAFEEITVTEKELSTEYKIDETITVETPDITGPEVSAEVPDIPEVIVTEVKESEMSENVERDIDTPPVLHVITDQPSVELSADMDSLKDAKVEVEAPEAEVKVEKPKKPNFGFSFGKKGKKHKPEPDTEEDTEPKTPEKKVKKNRSFNIKFPSFKRDKKPKVEKKKDDSDAEENNKDLEKDETKPEAVVSDADEVEQSARNNEKDSDRKGFHVELPKFPSFSLHKKKSESTSSEKDEKESEENEEKIVAAVEEKQRAQEDYDERSTVEESTEGEPVLKTDETVEITYELDVTPPTVDIEKPEANVSLPHLEYEVGSVEKEQASPAELPEIETEKDEEEGLDDSDNKSKSKETEKDEEGLDDSDNKSKSKHFGVQLPKLPHIEFKKGTKSTSDENDKEKPENVDVDVVANADVEVDSDIKDSELKIEEKESEPDKVAENNKKKGHDFHINLPRFPSFQFKRGKKSTSDDVERDHEKEKNEHTKKEVAQPQESTKEKETSDGEKEVTPESPQKSSSKRGLHFNVNLPKFPSFSRKKNRKSASEEIHDDHEKQDIPDEDNDKAIEKAISIKGEEKADAPDDKEQESTEKVQHSPQESPSKKGIHFGVHLPKFPSFSKKKEKKSNSDDIEESELEKEKEEAEPEKKETDTTDHESNENQDEMKKGHHFDIHLPKMPKFSLKKSRVSSTSEPEEKDEVHDETEAGKEEYTREIHISDPAIEFESVQQKLEFEPVEENIESKGTCVTHEVETVVIETIENTPKLDADLNMSIHSTKSDDEKEKIIENPEKEGQHIGIHLPSISLTTDNTPENDNKEEAMVHTDLVDGDDVKDKKENDEKEIETDEKRKGMHFHLPKFPSFSLKRGKKSTSDDTDETDKHKEKDDNIEKEEKPDEEESSSDKQEENKAKKKKNRISLPGFPSFSFKHGRHDKDTTKSPEKSSFDQPEAGKDENKEKQDEDSEKAEDVSTSKEPVVKDEQTKKKKHKLSFNMPKPHISFRREKKVSKPDESEEPNEREVDLELSEHKVSPIQVRSVRVSGGWQEDHIDSGEKEAQDLDQSSNKAPSLDLKLDVPTLDFEVSEKDKDIAVPQDSVITEVETVVVETIEAPHKENEAGAIVVPSIEGENNDFKQQSLEKDAESVHSASTLSDKADAESLNKSKKHGFDIHLPSINLPSFRKEKKSDDTAEKDETEEKTDGNEGQRSDDKVEQSSQFAETKDDYEESAEKSPKKKKGMHFGVKLPKVRIPSFRKEKKHSEDNAKEADSPTTPKEIENEEPNVEIAGEKSDEEQKKEKKDSTLKLRMPKVKMPHLRRSKREDSDEDERALKEPPSREIDEKVSVHSISPVIARSIKISGGWQEEDDGKKKDKTDDAMVDHDENDDEVFSENVVIVAPVVELNIPEVNAELDVTKTREDTKQEHAAEEEATKDKSDELVVKKEKSKRSFTLPKFPSFRKEDKPKKQKRKSEGKSEEDEDENDKLDKEEQKKKGKGGLHFTVPSISFKKEHAHPEKEVAVDEPEKEDSRVKSIAPEASVTFQAGATADISNEQIVSANNDDEDTKKPTETDEEKEKPKKDKKHQFHITLPTLSFKKSKHPSGSDKSAEKESSDVKPEDKENTEPDADNQEVVVEKTVEVVEVQKEPTKKKKRRIPSFGKEKKRKSTESEQPSEREIDDEPTDDIAVPVIVPKDIKVSSGWETDTTDPIHNHKAETDTTPEDVAEVDNEIVVAPPVLAENSEPEAGDLKPFDKDYHLESRVVRSVVIKTHTVKRGDDEPEEVTTMMKTEITKQDGDNEPEKEVTFVKKEIIDGEEIITKETNNGDIPVEIIGMPVLSSLPDNYEIVDRKVERKMIKKSKVTKTIIHSDGTEEVVVVDEKEECFDDKDNKMEEFEPDEKPERNDKVEAVPLKITEEGDEDFRLPSAEVEVVGDEVAPQNEPTEEADVADKSSVNGDVSIEESKTQDNGELFTEESKIHNETREESPPSDEVPLENQQAAASQSDSQTKGQKGNKGKRKRNRKR